MIFNVASDIIVGALGSGYILAQSHTLRIHSSTRQTLTAGCAQPPERRNVPSTPSLTRLRSSSNLNFWIQRVKTIENSTSCFSTTSRHPLGSYVTIVYIQY